MIPTLPLAARNRFADLVLRALHDVGARRELESVAIAPGDVEWMRDADARHVERLGLRARRAADVMRDHPVLGPSTSLGETLAVAAALFDAGLAFEVHELLERFWSVATGPTREALQGLIQVAAGYQHLANGNVAGARSLIGEGIVRLGTARLEDVDIRSFADALEARLPRFPDGVLPAPPFPRRS